MRLIKIYFFQANNRMYKVVKRKCNNDFSIDIMVFAFRQMRYKDPLKKTPKNQKNEPFETQNLTKFLCQHTKCDCDDGRN